MVLMPQMIEDGRIYKSVPPLFGMNVGTKKKPNWEYFTTRLDYSNYIQQLFSRENSICTTTDVMLSESEVSMLLFKNIMYVYELEVIANRYALDPGLLELALLLMNEPFKVMKERIEAQYRFITVEQSNSTIKITGLVNSMYQMLILNDKLVHDSKHIIDLIFKENASNIYYKVNGILMSLYGVMKLFDKTSPKNIKRFKGLGEMDEIQLADSTMDPDGNRTLIRYTMDDAKKEIEQIKYLQSNKDQLLSKINVSRYELLG